MRIILATSLFLLSIRCTHPDEAADRAKLMKLHEQSREFHFTKNAQAMVGGFADNFISVNRGKIDSVLSREEEKSRFQRYFNAVEFKKWDDLHPPIIRFSNDHSLAYMIIDKLVVLETKDTLGNLIEETTHFAWISIFRKQSNDDWKLECVASTNEPEVVKSLERP
jgi:hypothetical protein